MAWGKSSLFVLHCDQGMGNLIKIYTTIGSNLVLTNLALIDLGSEIRTKRYAGDAVDGVMDALREMNSGGVTPKIDLLVLSHQDYDHWSLLPDLRGKIENEFPDFKVGQLVTGGQRWKTQALTELHALETQFACTSQPLPRMHSDYDTPITGLRQLTDIGGVKFRVLAANSPISRSAEDLIRNGTSAVIVVECGPNKYILPGDATADTISFINDLLNAYLTHTGTNPISTCYVLSVPHHGALRTIADNFTTKNPSLILANHFAGLMSAKVVAASAGYLSQFKHPFKRVLDLLAVRSTSLADAHNYISYDDQAGDWDMVSNTTKDIFTTITTLTNPPGRMTWKFHVSPSGQRSFEVELRGAPIAAAPGRLMAVPASVLARQGTRQPLSAVPGPAPRIVTEGVLGPRTDQPFAT